MKVLSGAFHERRRCGGYAGLAAVLIVSGLAALTILLAPSLTKLRVQARQIGEDRRLQEIATKLIQSIRATQYIPGATNWISSLASFSGWNQTSIDHVYAEFPQDATTRRVLLLDPALGGALPYSQGLTSLASSLTNLAGGTGRALLISNTRRGLTLPVSSGPAASSIAFDTIWNWTPNPTTKAPPSGWPAAWNGYGDELHVTRINLANLFHTVALSNLRYIIDTNRISLPVLSRVDITLDEELFGILNDPISQVTKLVLEPIEMKVLDGTLLKVYDTNGSLYQTRRITGNIRYELMSSNGAPPLLHYRLSELSGTTATNSGTWGNLWNGVYTGNVDLGINQPAPPSYPSFQTNNYSAYFDGNKTYVETSRKMTNQLPAFTLAAWIRPVKLSSSSADIAGIRNSLSMNMYSSRRSRNILRITTKRGSNLSITYPHPLGEWHHVAAIGTGTQLQLYLNGLPVRSKFWATDSYYFDSGYTFRIATGPRPKKGGSSWISSKSSFEGGIDEVVFYNRALSTNEIAILATGQIP